ncbi:MAG: response regulator transcription factor [Spirochaetales bacterium]|nr:response regulator transcription factor [Spirochaetales bacterium]
MGIKIVLADDHKIVREGLRALIERQSNMEVVGEADNGHDLLRLVAELQPDIAIIDVTMPDLNGIEATRQITSMDGNINVIALSVHSDRRFVLEMLRAGAKGYIVKDSAFSELLRAIEVVMKGEYCLGPEVTGSIVLEYITQKSNPSSKAYIKLTPRQREICQLLAEGRSIKKISSSLNISIKTVETHRQNIMDKLDIHSIAELTKFAIKEGLTSL